MNTAMWDQLLDRLIEATRERTADWRRADPISGSFVLGRPSGSIVLHASGGVLGRALGASLQLRSAEGAVVDEIGGGMSSVTSTLLPTQDAPRGPQLQNLLEKVHTLAAEIAAMQTEGEELARRLLEEI